MLPQWNTLWLRENTSHRLVHMTDSTTAKVTHPNRTLRCVYYPHTKSWTHTHTHLWQATYTHIITHISTNTHTHTARGMSPYTDFCNGRQNHAGCNSLYFSPFTILVSSLHHNDLEMGRKGSSHRIGLKGGRN